MVELRRQFSGDACRISEMRDFVGNGCRLVWDEPSDAASIAQLELAVSEVASNIILHGISRQSDPELIELILNADRQQASVTFCYRGCEFSPDTVPTPKFDGRAESGYGMYLIQRSVDGVEFSRSDAGDCTIRLTRNRH